MQPARPVDLTRDDVLVVRPAARLRGSPRLPGDKSISHRALLLALLADGVSRIEAAGDGEDVRSTAGLVAALGATVERVAERDGRVDYRVASPGGDALVEPEDILDCGNSGTTARLAAGVLAGRSLFVVLDGDASLRRRPMGRIVEPLRPMGAKLAGRAGASRLPMAITGRSDADPDHVRDAGPQRPGQVGDPARRAVGRRRDVGDRGGRDPRPHRTHAARPRRGRRRGRRPRRPAHGARRRTDGRGRGRRDGAVRSLGRRVLAGGRVDPSRRRAAARRGEHEPDAACHHRHPEAHGRRHRGARSPCNGRGGRRTARRPRRAIRGLRAIDLSPAEVAAAIDEIPILALAAAVATGTSRFRGAGELRHKESDRIAGIAAGLGALGADVRVEGDDIEIHGGRPLAGAVTETHDDHRLAMTFAIAGLLAEGETIVRRPGSASRLVSRLPARTRGSAGMTKRVVLIGHPVAHSLSGAMQQAAFDHARHRRQVRAVGPRADRARRRHRRAARPTTSSAPTSRSPTRSGSCRWSTS